MGLAAQRCCLERLSIFGGQLRSRVKDLVERQVNGGTIRFDEVSFVMALSLFRKRELQARYFQYAGPLRLAQVCLS